MALYPIKKRKIWIIKAVDRRTGRTIAWVLGGRDAATFQRLYDKLNHLTACVFYTDNWNAFAQVLPKERHIIGKAHTHAIERDHSNTRHYLYETLPRSYDTTDQSGLKIRTHDSCVIKVMVCTHSAGNCRVLSSIVLIDL